MGKKKRDEKYDSLNKTKKSEIIYKRMTDWNTAREVDIHTNIVFESCFPFAWLPIECTLNYIAESVIELTDWLTGKGCATV